MARPKSVFKNSYNRLLDLLAKRPPGTQLPSASALATQLGVSPSTANAVVIHLEQVGLVQRRDRRRTVLRPPRPKDYFPEAETYSPSKRLEEEFLRSIVGSNGMPGDIINELQLARRFRTSTAIVREFLIRFSRFGLIEKRPNRHWVLHGLTEEFIDEVLTVREAFIFIGAMAMIQLPNENSLWQEIDSIQRRLDHFVAKKKVAQNEYQDLEYELYTLLAKASGNRFIADFMKTASTIVYYNFQIDRRWEIKENKGGAELLVTFIGCLQERNPLGIQYWNRKMVDIARKVYSVAVLGNRH
jgi:DNA-binding GntR family transcriptional regulator